MIVQTSETNSRQVHSLARQLHAKTAEIQHRLTSKGLAGLPGQGSSGPECLDESELADRSHEEWIDTRRSHLDQVLLHQISEALIRVEMGEFGLCVDCGERISVKRLKAVPWASHCIECADRGLSDWG